MKRTRWLDGLVLALLAVASVIAAVAAVFAAVVTTGYLAWAREIQEDEEQSENRHHTPSPSGRLHHNEPPEAIRTSGG